MQMVRKTRSAVSGASCKDMSDLLLPARRQERRNCIVDGTFTSGIVDGTFTSGTTFRSCQLTAKQADASLVIYEQVALKRYTCVLCKRPFVVCV